eukprot:ANDGO_06118.mRNA.1 Trafficking protein particle complex subunit 2-like protein
MHWSDMIYSIAVIGRLNNPLYLATFQGAADRVRFSTISHAALDVIQERIVEGHAESPYLGLLFPVDDLHVYGYVTNTNIKFVVITLETFENDAAMHHLFSQIHEAYLTAISNPFAPIDTPLAVSPKFHTRVALLVQAVR